MNYRFLGLFFILLLSIPASAMKKKEIPQIPIKSKSVLNNAMFKVVPEYIDLAFIPGQGSWQLWYEKLNESYRGVIRYQDENRVWVKETLPVIAKGCLQDQYGKVTKLPYAPAWFALGVLEYEDGNYNLAEKHFLKASEIAQHLPQERASHIHSAYGYALTATKQGRFDFASSLLAHMFVTLTDHERPHWERTLRQEITKLKEHITTPWNATQLLLLSTSKKDRNMALEMWKSIPACMLNVIHIKKEIY